MDEGRRQDAAGCTLGPLPEVLDVALTVASDAAALVRASERQTVEYKGAIDLVTNVDRASEALIAGRLRQAFPRARLVLEEAGGVAPSKGPVWYVDPLDGTTNFAHDLPHVAITLALVEGGRLLVGVVADVFRQELYGASLGGGAWLCSEPGEQRRPLHVSQTERFERALVATGFPYDRHTSEDDNLAAFAAVLKRAQGVRRAGSAALDLAWVARGRLDAYWEAKLHPWDVAAGALLVREAGGLVTDYAGAAPAVWGRRTVATNGPLHRPLLTLLQAVRAPGTPGAPFVIGAPDEVAQ